MVVLFIFRKISDSYWSSHNYVEIIFCKNILHTVYMCWYDQWTTMVCMEEVPRGNHHFPKRTYSLSTHAQGYWKNILWSLWFDWEALLCPALAVRIVGYNTMLGFRDTLVKHLSSLTAVHVSLVLKLLLHQTLLISFLNVNVNIFIKLNSDK